jgi:dolichyl-phosphate beta-glucosyltransferase
MSSTVIVIPCFNEGKRLDEKSFAGLVAEPDVALLFVNDGSSDNTSGWLRQFASKNPDRIRVLDLAKNVGKGEAIRQGILSLLKDESVDSVGFADADMATPAEELVRLAHLLQTSNPDAQAVIGSRVQLLGTHIKRRRSRHYLGRIVATYISDGILKRPVYDTQCAAKFFRVNDAFRKTLERPFRTRWLFDVEMIGRLWQQYPANATPVIEIPLQCWHDVRGSKISWREMVRIGWELLQLAGGVR